MNDALTTVEFAILNQLIGRVPAHLNDHLQQVAKVAAEAVRESATAWAFEMVAAANKPGA